ncbi:MAG: hypothetical protein JXR03_12025 [Cyclobacteriaceae bacterium]
MIRHSACLLIVSLLSLSCLAQDQAGYACYSFPDVRANEVIKGITKDSDGHVWLATDLGVLVFNGSSTVTYSSGLGSLYTKKFEILKDNRLLVISDGGVQLVEKSSDSVKFKPFEYFGHSLDSRLQYPKSIFQDRSETLWIGESNAITRVTEESISTFNFGNNFSYHRSFSFTEDAFNNIWSVSHNGQLIVFNPELNQFDSIHFESPIKNYTGIVTVKGDFIIGGGDYGLIMLKVDSDREILRGTVYSQVEDISTLEVVGNLVIIGTWDSGLFYFDYTEKNPVFKKFDELGFNDVVDLFYDEDHDEIWVAGSEDMAMLKRPEFSHIGEIEKYRIESFDYTQDQDLYFTTGEEIFVHRKGAPDKELLVLAENIFFTSVTLSGDTLWVGDNLGSVFNYDLNQKELIRFKEIESGKQPVNHLNNIDGDIWIASSGSGVRRIDQNLKFADFGTRQMNVVKKSPAGDIYSGGTGPENLLIKLNRQAQEFESLKVELSYTVPDNIRVEDIAFDQNGAIYIASSEGVLMVEKNGDKYFSKQKLNFSEDQPVYSCRAIEYVEGRLWIATNEGLFLYSEDGSVQFNTLNGLPSRLVKQRGLDYRDGILTVATAQGLSIIDPDKLSISKTTSPVIDKLRINDNVPSSSEELLNIPYRSNLEVDFQCLTYPNKDIQYQTRVIGLNDQWNNPSENRIVSLLGLSQGTYKIEVRAKSIGHLWSEPTTIEYRVLNPWYMSWWVYICVLVLAIVILVVSNKIYNNNLIKQKKKLKRLVEKGTAEIEKQKNEIIEQQTHIIQQKEQLIEKNETVFKAKEALTDADLKYLHLKETQLKDQVEYKNKQITTHTLNIIQKNETLLQLKDKLEKIVKESDLASNVQVKKTIKFIEESFKQDKDWEDFKLYFEEIYTGFYTKLKAKCPELTGHELRHCALIRLNLSIQECASIMGISPDSVKVSRARIRKKIQTDAGKGLSEFILSL